ncbi:MAG: hypothetical protein M1498_01275 [Candidatus Thermoplasmatota archaeon]|nr:hypothetical protein [Candidatus Thermoplasmatota archaeon]MCL5889285.1 hypothetical protein [Candidatus Thermoplasmatota archaeon]
MEKENNDQEAIKEIQDILSGDNGKRKRKGFFSRRKKAVREETQIRVKTILDIPPLVNARRNIGNRDVLKAATDAKRDVQKDIERYFSINLGGNLPNMSRLYKALKETNKDLTEEITVDTVSLELGTALTGTKSSGDNQMKEMALKKYAAFVMGIYLPAVYSQDEEIEGEKIISMVTDIYDYMDIKKLYFVDE